MRVKAAAMVLAGALALVGTACSGETDPDQPAPADSTTADPATGASGDEGGEHERAPAAFNSEQVSGTFDCAGQDVTINGSDADLHLVGECGTVVINGERAEVVVDDAVLIVVNGESAQVIYSGSPRVTVNGENASAEAA